METLTTKTELVNELEETVLFCGPDESNDSSESENNDGTVKPQTSGESGTKKETEEEVRPGGF